MTVEQRLLVVEAQRRWADGWLPSAAEVDALFAAFAAFEAEERVRLEDEAFDGLPTYKVGQY